jgi:tRNA pseudouridine38-40 synthase
VRLFDPDDAALSGAAPLPKPAAPDAHEASAGGEPAVSEEREAAPVGPLCRVRLLVVYDGTSFHGFAHQPGQTTIAGRLKEALARVAGHDVTLTCAGRTDTGVHAAGQVIHADVVETFFQAQPDRERLIRSLTHQVGPEIAVLDVERAVDGFDARRSALSRRYRYRLLCSAAPDPLLRHETWHVPRPLDVAAMRLAVDTLLGEHDFSAFCRRPPDGGSLVRRVSEATLRAEGSDRGAHAGARPALNASSPEVLRFEIEAKAFCHQMVRSIVGAIVSVGEGKLTAAGVLEMLRAGDRSGGCRLAPPGGLCLESVRYPTEMVPGGVWRPPTCQPHAWADVPST